MGKKNVISPQRKIGSMVGLFGGLALIAVALIMDFQKSSSTVRGPLLIIGALALLCGVYFFPTLKHHRTVV
ncbi:MAG: sugar ABC transporter permease, partial [Pseudobutyrivibrio sp.]|nr:sugar ABC transporter permease [Eubacterium sp.]MBQ5425847.1 sugar ABC transporter permease [Pseudobutyrivibrio sp.]